MSSVPICSRYVCNLSSCARWSSASICAAARLSSVSSCLEFSERLNRRAPTASTTGTINSCIQSQALPRRVFFLRCWVSSSCCTRRLRAQPASIPAADRLTAARGMVAEWHAHTHARGRRIRGAYWPHLTTLCLAANIEKRVYVLVEGRKGMEVNQPRAVHVGEGEGKMLWVADELMTFKATAEDTGGAYSLTDSVVPPGGGSFVHLPKDIPHAYENVGTGPARFLTLMVPGGVEKFFEEVGKPGSDVSSPPPFEEEDIEKFLAVAPKYGAEILPPPEQ